MRWDGSKEKRKEKKEGRLSQPKPSAVHSPAEWDASYTKKRSGCWRVVKVHAASDGGVDLGKYTEAWRHWVEGQARKHVQWEK